MVKFGLKLTPYRSNIQIHFFKTDRGLAPYLDIFLWVNLKKRRPKRVIIERWKQQIYLDTFPVVIENCRRAFDDGTERWIYIHKVKGKV